MITTTLAAGDLFTAIPNLFNDALMPGALCLIAAGIVGAIVGLHKGFGTAAGKLIGGITLAAIALGSVGLTVSIDHTLNKHGGNVLTGQYGQ
ncbi:hypothetical protein Y900_030120 [Mycolicibacterium aromaticivorans JS19b1 = JCM 16368]|uniref:Uncharacterized protein n=1 Tax=Mycolicibacterium aromaticivorans JS19b1 = JCM 16368 TaxID=1440774 RepID=A0A064CDR5_9MYCO|nr:hypothetical protein [Mycolicibacterium aromaticivorans]KDE96892.1 hypothetical protein Y900_030120 [Mycolicibacterium aromaticivorans JS19b1 = JCM 16368]